MAQTQCKCANFNMMFTEFMAKKNSEDANIYDFVERPDAVIEYIHTCARF
jgi:hypothetical protein